MFKPRGCPAKTCSACNKPTGAAGALTGYFVDCSENSGREESRYFGVLLAHDFQAINRQKQRKLLWETRFSLRERRNDFSLQLAAMAQSASRYLGEEMSPARARLRSFPIRKIHPALIWDFIMKCNDFRRCDGITYMFLCFWYLCF